MPICAMKLAVIGTGYVGLTTGACLAELGHVVVCHDIEDEKIKKLKNKVCPIFEVGLPELLVKHTGRSLFFTSSIKEAICEAEVIFICVGTPPKKEGGADLSAIDKVLENIGKNLDHYAIIVEKSTVPVQTAEWMKSLLKKHLKTEFDIAVNPEFLREGTSVHDFLHPDRIVVGTESEKADKIMTELYSKTEAPVIHTDLNSAELIKHSSNAFLSMKISFANMVSRLCEKTGGSVSTVMDGVGWDTRIGRAFLNAGLGYGGYCFPKDLDAFIHIFEKHKVDCSLLKGVRSINESQRLHALEIAKEMLGSLNGKTVGVLGLAFKPNTDDVRLSPACLLIEELQKEGAKVRSCDPQAVENAQKILKGVVFCKDAYEVAKGCDLLILATEWSDFKTMDLSKIKAHVTKFLDSRLVFDPARMRKLGFEYRCIGRS